MASRKKPLSNKRENVVRRLKRKGLIKSTRGYTTEYLLEMESNLFKEYTVTPVKMNTNGTNYENVVRILKNFAHDFREHFVGWIRDAWIVADELDYFWLRIDEDKINSYELYVPQAIVIEVIPPSDWFIDEQYRLDPLNLPQYLEKKYWRFLK